MAVSIVVGWALAGPASAGVDRRLTRYPYLTDSVQTSITLNWASTRAATTGSVRYGPPGHCTASSRPASRTAITVGSRPEYQWKATIPVVPDTTYCYRVSLGATDLLGSDPSPAFTSQVAAGSAAHFSFDVFGDWGQANPPDATGSANPDQENVLARMARSGARFAVMTGDTAYPQGSQTNYGDLGQTGVDVSGVFGARFWAVPGRSLPVFNATGNHGFRSGNTQVVNWPEQNAASSSGGSYRTEWFPSLGGRYPSFWYAFDAGPARFYVLTSAWADDDPGPGGSVYANDALMHWQTSSAEYRWLAHDLATHRRALKFAFWHYPLHADTYRDGTDAALQDSLEPLLDRYGVDIAFNGHAHGYERNRPDAAGLVSYVFGNGGADLGVLRSCLDPFDAYAIGGHGSHCGAAPGGLADDHVFGFAKVAVAGRQVTVTPTDELGRTFDVQRYTFPLVRRPPSGPPRSRACVTRAGPIGTPGADLLRGTRRRDRLFGLGGADCLYGLAGRDVLRGGSGRDRLYGGPGADHLYGGSGADRLYGGRGADVLRSGRGRGRLYGGPGRDRIHARNGARDVIRCGSGRDTAYVDRRDRVRGCETVRRR